MIAVIADDFSGAAELAGISLRFGLTVDLCLNGIKETDADVLVVCTDSRSMNKEEALQATEKVVNDVINAKPLLIYKKIDSVLRGYVVDEIKVQMKTADIHKAFILPANPSLNRTISNGEYFIDGKRITESNFVNDPEFPISSSLVVKMLKDDKVTVVKREDELPATGIVIAEAQENKDVKYWADMLDESWLLVGAGDFFTAILEKRYWQQTPASIALQTPLLFVSGTAFNDRKQFVKQLQQQNASVAYMPAVITEEWLNEASEKINQHQYLVIAFEHSLEDALILRTMMAKAVKALVERNGIPELFIEGGSTAAAVLQELEIDILQPTHELSRGVVRMKANNLFITVKPGSYQLPDIIKNRVQPGTIKNKR